MDMTTPRPLVLVSCSTENIDMPGFALLEHQAVFARYIDAVGHAFDCTVLLLPAHEAVPAAVRHYAVLADGIVLTGAASNVAPDIYGGARCEAPERLDVLRDWTTLPLVRCAVEEGVPLLGICRGMQEINVALGGTLHQDVHEIPGRRDHRSDKQRVFADRYHAAHPLHIVPGGWLASTARQYALPIDDFQVNSLHRQAVDRLGLGVVVDATADDGTIEALHVPGARALTIGVQWHAEWYVDDTPLHRVILAEFGRACRARADRRLHTTKAVS